MKKIGKFKICGLLGKGGMGKVFKIEYPVIGKIGAMKILDPHPFLASLLSRDEIEEMFISEAVKMAGIRHPHIVEILDFDRFGEKPYYIMEYYCNNLGAIIGESYEAEKKSRIIHVDKAIDYTRQILSGLSKLHSEMIVHRDIKPFNLLINDDDAVKICDFGLSKLRKERLKGHSSLKIGSPYYAAPEQENDPDSAEFGSDLYSVGVMLYRMVTGSLPLRNDRKPSMRNSDLDSDWDDFLLKALEKNPSGRYSSAERMLRDLEILSSLWAEKKSIICAAPSSPFENRSAEKTTMRSTCKKISRKEAGACFKTDSLMRPETYIKNIFENKTDKTVEDRQTGLLWQISGTRYPVNWQQAANYINRLNADSYCGRNDWRLPTADELLSIVNPPPEGEGYCLEPVFDTGRKWLWSCDRCTFISAWYVNLDLGYADCNDFTSFYHVKAVCSL